MLCVAGTDGYFKRVNPAFTKALGYSENHLLSTPFLDFVHPDDQQKTRAEVAKLTVEEGTENFENRYRCKNGDYKWFNWMWCLDPVTDLLYAVARDVSAQKDVSTQKNKEEEATWIWQLLEESLNELYICDAETFRFIHVNSGARKNLGYSDEELKTQTPLDIKPEITRKIFEELISPLRSGDDKAVKFATVHERKDGSRYNVEVHLQLSKLGTLPVFIAIVFDLTERKRIQKELEETAYNLRRTQEIAQLGSFSLGIKAPERDMWSEEMYRILGRSPKQMPASRSDYIKHIVHPEDRAFVARAFTRSVEEAIPFDVQHRILRPNGTVRYVHGRAEPIAGKEGDITKLLGTLLDITHQKQNEHELSKAVEQTKAILDATVDGIITIGDCGNIQSFNKAAERIFLYSAEEVIGQNVKMLMPIPYHEDHNCYLQNYINTGQRKVIGVGREVIGKRKDGSVFPMELAVSETKLGKRRLFTGLVRDISEYRQMELEILQISEFDRQNIGQELHDGLGSQLSGIGMICQRLIQQLGEADSPLATNVSEIVAQIKEADYQARNIARGLVPVSTDPSGLRMALKRLSESAERTNGVSCFFVEKGEVLIKDAFTSTHLFRIAQEAFDNAVKHGKASRITIVAEKNRSCIALKVEDNGIGIPEILPEGRGVGLRTMQHRASVIGARLVIEQGKKGGTVVSCILNNMLATSEAPIAKDSIGR